MAAATDTFSAWLAHARIVERRLTPDQRGVLQVLCAICKRLALPFHQREKRMRGDA
jgi:hypothetical protein